MCSTTFLLNTFNMVSLHVIRKLACNVFLSSLSQGYINSPKLLKEIGFLGPRPECRYQLTFLLATFRTNHYFHSPIVNMCRNYVNICRDVNIFDNNQKSFRGKCQNTLFILSISDVR